MVNIFVTGIEESGKEVILDMVLQSSKKLLPKFRYIKFSEFGVKDIKDTLSSDINKIKKMRNNLNKKLEKIVNEELKKAKSNIIINGYFTLKTQRGYLPAVSAGFFKLLNPDVLINIEFDTNVDKIHIKHVVKNIGNINTIREYQEINRKYAILYSALTGAPVETIKVKYGNVKKALRETGDIIRVYLKG